MLAESKAIPLYKTPIGTAYLGDSLVGMDKYIKDETARLAQSPELTGDRRRARH
jgi:hypothetical protein